MKYSDKFKDPRWQKKRLEIFERDNWYCRLCQDNEKTLHIHHMVYQKGKEPWEYKNEYLLTLCETCHEEETAARHTVERKLCLELAKKGFMSSELILLSEGFHEIAILHAPEVTAKIINFALKTPEIMGLLESLFFKHIDKKIEEGKNGKTTQTGG